MESEKLLLNRLIAYGESDAYPFHMPGHKRMVADGGLREFPNPFSVDITEIDGFDNLHHPEGILKESMEWAAGVYGADRTWYLVNGSSSGILSAICAATRPGGRILMSRNCHKSAYHGVILNGLETSYVYPHILDDLGIQGGIAPADVDKFLTEYPNTQAVLIVSPTYEGIVSDVAAIADVVHRRGLPLIVDEAHGAHFSFGGRQSDGMPSGAEQFPWSALSCGADVVVQSLHKTLPSLTQTAVLHMRGNRVERGRLERYLQMFQSSSPSYVLMASIERCIYEMATDGPVRMAEFQERIAGLRERLRGLKALRILDERAVGSHGVYAVDASKLVVSCRECVYGGGPGGDAGALCEEDAAGGVDVSSEDAAAGSKAPGLRTMTGEAMGTWLREKHHLEMELCGADYVVAILTCLDSAEGLTRLADGLLELDGLLESETLVKPDTLLESETLLDPDGLLKPDGELELGGAFKLDERRRLADTDVVTDLPVIQNGAALNPDICMKLADAVDAPWTELPLEACAGRISTEFIYLYPPGIPIVAPGERVTEEALGRILYYKRIGLPVQGMADAQAARLRVRKE